MEDDLLYYIEDKEVVQILSSVLHIQSIIGDEHDFVIGGYGQQGREELISYLSVLLATSLNESHIVCATADDRPELYDISPDMHSVLEGDFDTDISGFDGVIAPSIIGSWSQRADWLDRNAKECDRAKYLRIMMPSIMCVQKEWIASHTECREVIRPENNEIRRQGNRAAQYRNAYMKVPLRS